MGRALSYSKGQIGDMLAPSAIAYGLKEVKRASLECGGLSTAIFEFAGIFSTILMGSPAGPAAAAA